MKKREDRRDRTIRKGERRRREHLRWRHPNGVVDCVCELSAWRFAKRKGLGCESCRSRKKGQPKLPDGMCRSGNHGYRDAVVERIDGRRRARRWLEAVRAGEDCDD